MEPIHFNRLILHPGSPKTGTSGLQNFLFRKRAELLEHGYLYPLSGIPTEGGTAKGHHALALHLDPAAAEPSAELRDMVEGMRAEIAAAPDHVVLLSSEEFFGAHRIGLLKQYLRPQHCHIYVSLRPQPEVMNANYYTQVTHNRIKHPPAVYFDWAINRLRYLENMEAFAGFCDDTEISLRIFEKGSAVRSSPIEDFLSVMQIPLEYDAKDNTVEHPTLPAQPTLFLRWLNELGFDQASFFDVFQSLHKMRAKLPRDTYTMSPARIAAVIETFDADNREIRRRYLDGEDAPLFSPPDLPDPEQWENSVGEDYTKVERAFFKRLCVLAGHEK